MSPLSKSLSALLDAGSRSQRVVDAVAEVLMLRMAVAVGARLARDNLERAWHLRERLNGLELRALNVVFVTAVTPSLVWTGLRSPRNRQRG